MLVEIFGFGGRKPPEEDGVGFYLIRILVLEFQAKHPTKEIRLIK